MRRIDRHPRIDMSAEDNISPRQKTYKETKVRELEKNAQQPYYTHGFFCIIVTGPTTRSTIKTLTTMLV